MQDNGIGFDPAQALSSRGQSSAWGLLGIRERTVLLNGHYEIKSAPGQGTLIRISIPTPPPAEAATEPLAPAHIRRLRRGCARSSPHDPRICLIDRNPQEGRPAPIRLLLVDDHSILRAGLRMLFAAEHDLQIVGEAGSGAEAIEAVRNLHPDVVIMDVAMPGMTGIEATRRIKETYPEWPCWR